MNRLKKVVKYHREGRQSFIALMRWLFHARVALHRDNGTESTRTG